MWASRAPFGCRLRRALVRFTLFDWQALLWPSAELVPLARPPFCRQRKGLQTETTANRKRVGGWGPQSMISMRFGSGNGPCSAVQGRCVADQLLRHQQPDGGWGRLGAHPVCRTRRVRREGGLEPTQVRVRASRSRSGAAGRQRFGVESVPMRGGGARLVSARGRVRRRVDVGRRASGYTATRALYPL